MFRTSADRKHGPTPAIWDCTLCALPRGLLVLLHRLGARPLRRFVRRCTMAITIDADSLDLPEP
ncbi:hypothetical protein AURDEDRAFT_116307 [Auricularia subglabra TFB-10046 SS5]|nr:hypothetical protein AURDEDRAFT_116307 [Auricularia subglabra TFB-10046 SS5]